MKLNKTVKNTRTTAEGAPAKAINPEQQLRRSVMCCMLWEDQFYEGGKTIADRIEELVAQVSPDAVEAIARDARDKMKLRHAPLLIVRAMARLSSHKGRVANLLADVIQRPDEITEFLAIYWKDKRQPLSAQVKKGLGRAFAKFSEYQLAKYNRDGAVKLRDALFLSHAKPTDAQGITKTKRAAALVNLGGTGYIGLNPHEELYRKIVDAQLQTPDTWEVQLSGGADKKETFLRLMAERKLGALAFLRNLRNMHEAGINKAVVADYAAVMNVDRVLPFRFIAAARHVPQWEPIIELAMLRCLDNFERLPGRTALLMDVSGSMNYPISSKSELLRLDAGYGLGILLREICEDVDVLTFSDKTVTVPPRRGFALRDAMHKSQPHGGTYLGSAVNAAIAGKYDRIIIITDEQSHDSVPDPKGLGYVINVASYRNGIGYGPWVHIDGWSEAVIDFIREYERGQGE